jgi:hypothetical protein
MPGSDLDLVTRGYTISVRTAAFGRIGEQYVMRDRKGHRVALPLDTQPDFLLEVWTAFNAAAAEKEPVVSMPTGETVSAGDGAGLPAAPPDRGWRLVAATQHLDFSRRHVTETQQRIVRQATLIQSMEQSGCAKMATIGRTLLDALQSSLRAAHANVERRQELLCQSNGGWAGPHLEPHAREVPTESRHSAGAELAQIGS